MDTLQDNVTCINFFFVVTDADFYGNYVISSNYRIGIWQTTHSLYFASVVYMDLDIVSYVYFHGDVDIIFSGCSWLVILFPSPLQDFILQASLSIMGVLIFLFSNFSFTLIFRVNNYLDIY